LEEQTSSDVKIFTAPKSDELIQKMIQKLESKPERTIEEKLKLRNLKRIFNIRDGFIYCPLKGKKLPREKFTICWVCAYGHFLFCHYPYTCDSEYCNKYKFQE